MTILSFGSSREGFGPLLVKFIAADWLLGGGLVCRCSAQRAVAGKFSFSVDLLEGMSGYFRVKGHNGVQPTLAMVR